MDKSDILDQLFDQDYVEKEIDVIPGKRTAVITNLKASEQLRIEQELSETEGNAVYTIHNYTMKLLAATLKKWGDEEVDSFERAEEIVGNMPSRLVDKLVNKQRELEDEISEALGVENIQENFSRTGDLQPDSEQKQEESS